MWGILISLSSDGRDYAAELSKIKQEIKEVSAEIEKLKRKEKDLSSKVELYEKKKALLENYLHVLKGQESTLRVRLEFTQKKLDELEKDEGDLLKRIRAGVNLLYLLRPTSVWSAVFNPSKAYSMYERARSTEATLQAYSNALKQIEGFKRDYDWWRRRREKILKQINENIREQEQALKEIKETEEELQKAIDKIRKDRKEKELYVAKLRAKAERLESILKKLAKREKERKREKISSKGELKGKIMWPIGGRVVRKFGYYTDPKYGVRLKSTGIDISAPYDGDVVAAESGKVVYAGKLEGYGNVVILEHEGFFTVYANLKNVSVDLDQKVRKGQRIGKAGRRPVHFEIRLGSGSEAVDPLLYLP